MANRGSLISILTWIFITNTIYIFYLHNEARNANSISYLPAASSGIAINSKTSFTNGEFLAMSDQNNFIKGSTIQIWNEIYGVSISSFIRHPLYPELYSSIEAVANPANFRCKDTNSARKLFGYLQPLQAANYTFSLSSDDSSQFWISKDNTSSNLQLSCAVGLQTINSISSSMALNAGVRYYYEILHKQSFGDCFLKLLWKTENSSIFEEIKKDLFWQNPQSSDRHFMKHKISNYEKQFKEANVSQRIDLFSGIPICSASLGVSNRNTSGRYNKIIALESEIEMSVYPNDGTQKLTYVCDEMKADILCFGNSIISFDEIDSLQRKVSKILRRQRPKSDGLIKINEATRYTTFGGTRQYSLDISVYHNEEISRSFIEYVEPKSGNGIICSPYGATNGFKSPRINVVITVSNQAIWLEYFLSSIQRVIIETQEENLHVIIVDFSSTDLIVDTMVTKYPHVSVTIIKIPSLFEKIVGIKQAVNSVKNQEDLVFLMDLHIEFPNNIFELARKHSRKGFSIFSPIVMRLAPGHTKANPAGYWELMGHGIFAMFKYDWKRLNGIDSIHGNRKWGGEDWELLKLIIENNYEIKRIRLVGFYHYYHSHNKLWDKSKDVDRNNQWSIGTL